MDNKIDRIIKKILKEQGNPLRPSGLYNPEMVTVRPENAFDNFDTYKSPNGIGFVIPKKILTKPVLTYSKQAWIDYYANNTNARGTFDNLLKNKNTTYLKLCYDGQLSQIIREFLKVRDKWIPDDIKTGSSGVPEKWVNDAIAVMDHYRKINKTYTRTYV